MRYRSVVHMHFVNRMQAFGWQPIALAIAFVIILTIGIIFSAQSLTSRLEMYEGMTYNGAIFAILGPMIGYGFASMGQYFPLAMGMGITRREFALGLTLVFLGNALVYSVLITLGKIIEAATDGFGLYVRFFDVFFVGTGPAWQTFVQTFLVLMTVMFLGAAITSGYLRFGQPFIWLFVAVLAGVAVAILAGVVLIDGFGTRALDVLTMGWTPWMVVIGAIGVVSAGAWLLMVRRTQVR